MAKDYIGYQALTDAALRGVVRDALKRVESQGLIGSHHFYLTFKTHFPGVEIPAFLREQYPDEMTIILQHQFWGLKVHEDLFEVALTFKKMPATLVIPFVALTAFFDPGVQFGLQFKTAEGDIKTVPPSVAQEDELPLDAPSEEGSTDPGSDDPQPGGPRTGAPKGGTGEVVSLDKFRKK